MAGTNWADFTPVDNDAPTAVDWSQFEVIPKANAAQRMLDIGKSFASGGVGATKAIADAGGASNAVSKRLGGAQDALQDMLSPERQAERAMRAKTIADAEQSGSTLREVGAHLGGFAEAPISTIAEAAGSVVPVVASMFTPVGRRAGARAALSLGLGAAQGAGSVKGSIYDAVQQKHVEQGATPEAAQQAAEKAQAYSGPNLDSIGVGAVLGAVAGRSGVESTVNRIIGGKAAMGGQSVLRRAAVGTVAEGLPEAAQGGQERLSSNLALQKEGFEMPTWQGVAGQAASEGLAGGVLGGGINAASRGHARPAAQPGAPVNLDDPSVGVDSAAPPAIDPAAGPLSKAAAMAVDNGAGPAMPESTWTADTAGNVMTGEQRKAGVALADAAALVTPAPISELAAMVENLPVDVRRDARFTLKELQRQDLPAGVRAFHENQLRGLVGEQAPEVDPVDQQPLGDVTAAYDARTPTQTAPTWVRQYQESRLQGEQYPDLISYLDRLPREAELADAYFKDGQWEAQKQHFRATGMPHPEEAEVDDAYRMLQTKDAAVTPEQRAEALQTIRTVLDDELGDFDTDRAIDAPAQELSLVPNQPARYEGGIDYTAPARPVARPQVDRQSSDDATIARLALADNIEPGAAMRLDRAHALRRQAADAGIPVSVVPHPSGRGYAVAPTSRLDPAARNATPQSEAAATLPYDQSPSGRMLAGAAGAAGVRPELRGEAVSAGNAIQQQRAELDAERQRRDELGLSNTTPVRPVTQPAPTGQPALAYDTTPTGNMVAGIDGVRREIRADVINRNQASNAVVEKALDQPLAPEAPAQAATETVAPITADNRREEPGSARIGRDQRPLAEGGKPFKTRKAAGDAKKLQPMMRVVSVEGGYALADKTPAQLAAEAKASKRLSNASTSPAGEPIPAHAFIAAAGGLNVRAKPDMGIDGNPRVGNRTLFAGLGKGLTIERATEQLVENGYLSEGASHNDAMALIKRSLSQPQYNADGIERIAEAETAARFEDYVDAQEEAFADGEPDPFGMPDDFTPDELEDVGYTAADPKLQAEVNALMAQVDAMGLDASEILEDIVRTYANASQDEFSAAAKRALEAAITRSSGDGGSVAAQTPAAADTPQELTAAGGLTGPTFTAKLAPGVNSLFGNPQYHEAEAYAQTLPRGQYAQVTTERAGYPPRPTLHGAWVSNGDGTASFVQDVFPASSVPLTDGSIAALYAAHVEKEQKQQTKSAAATKTRLELIESKRLRVGAEWAGAETYVEGRDGKTKFSKSKITAIGGNGFLTVESTLRGSNRLYRFTVDANSHLFDNYPTLERLGLNSPTRDDVLAQQERADTGAKAEAARKKSDADKAKADAERGEFTLTGSDRAADVGAAGGQQPMFSRAPAAKADKAAAKAAAAQKSRDEAFAKWSDNAPMVTSAQAGSYTFKTGEKVVVEAYHGSQRPDRIGGVFDPKRATSGPMAYFTSSPELASTYAKGKSDTSLADEDQQYANWFKVKVPGQRSEVDIARAWSSLTPEQKATIERRMPDIRQDEDGNVVYEEGGGDPGSYEWELQQTQRGYDRRGNPLKAAVETWLTSGTLFDQELDFMKVLQLAGFPVKDVRPDFPTDQFPGVFKTFVAMKKPLVVSDIPAEVDAALAEAARRDRGRVQPQGADTWDKRARTVRDWYEQYKGLDRRDPAYAWTSIPDKVTDVFKSFGYDGIIDWSGKGGGHQHPVYIPFGPTQVKSAFNRGTFDPNKKDINFSRTPARKASDANLVATQQLVDGLKANWTNAPEIIVARNMQDTQIPQSVRDYDQTLKSQGATGEARGFIYQGKVYLLADQLNGPHQIAEVLFHEVLGHYGLRRAFGKGLTPILQQVATMRRKEMQAKAKEYGLDLTNERDRLTAAEEILAEMAQATPEIGFVKRAIAVIRNWMRANVPGFQSLRLTDNDIIQAYILPARGAVTRSKETGQQSIERAMASFSRAPATDTKAFKDWFGENGVADSDGNPRIFTHSGRPGLNIIHNQGRFGGIFVLPEGQNARYGSETYKLALRGKIASTDDLREFASNSPKEVAALLGEKVGSDAYESALEIVLDQSVTDDNAALVGGIDAADGFAEMQKLRGRIARAAGATAVEMEDEFSGDTLLVVDGRQVKDVERNNGSFDPANPDIRFSRTAPGGIAARVGESLKSVTATNIKERAGFKLTDYLGLGLQLLGRRQLVDIYGDTLPLNQYNRLAQQMEADKNEVGAEADALATAWAKLPDERQLAELMHDATLAQMDPAKPLVAGDNAIQHGVLRKRFNDLTPEAQKVYLGARDSYQAHHKGVLKAIKERIERSELKGPRKAALLAQMDDEFYKAVKGVYFPLARFGQYVVVTTGPDGKVSNVSRAETMNEGQATRKQMLLAFPASKGYKVGKVILSKEFVAGRDAVGRGFMTELYAVLDKQDMDSAARAELEDTLGQLYLSSLPDLSWAKHGIHRKGTPGYSQDARRAFAQNMFHGARYLAKLRYSDLMQDELTAMQKHVDDWVEVPDADFNSARAQRVVDEFNKRHEAHMNPKSNPLSTALTSFGFIFHLGLSPASALVNLTQTALVAYPVMGAKWGFDKSAAALMKASQQAVQGKNDITGSLNEEERRAYDEAVRNGTIDVTMAHDLAGISQGEDAGVMWKIRPVMKWASFMFHHAERFNRQVTFVASYRLAREAGAAHEAAFEQATKATYDGHFDYSSANRPRVMQGNAARVLLLFKQYGQNMVYSLARSAQQSLKGATPQERTEARRVLGGLLAMHGMAAGALGLPMVTTLLAVASMLGGSDDEPWDAQVALQNMLADAFGQKPAEVLSHGLSRLTPWDISGRVGLDKLILPDIQEGLEGQRLGESAMAAALGPVAGIGINVLKGMQEIGEGRYQRGLEAMAPSVLRGPLKAWRYAWEGAKDKTGIVIQDEVDAAAWFGQALGFSPSSVRNATEGKSAILAHDRALQARRSGLVEQFAMASMAGDEEGKADARSDIATFNEKHPDRYIKPMQLAQSVRARTKRIEEAQDGVYLPKKRRDAMEAGRFAIE